MASESKLIGTTVTLNAIFRNESDAVVTPLTVNLKYKKPNSVTIYTESASADSRSRYQVDVLLDTVGVWNFRWESVGANSTAKEFSITVIDTKVK